MYGGRTALAPARAKADTVSIAPVPRRFAVSLNELETAVTRLDGDELAAFARWFEEYLADAWDRRIEADIQAGLLDEAGRRADEDFEAGRCKPL